jgi:hypothetical protein
MCKKDEGVGPMGHTPSALLGTLDGSTPRDVSELSPRRKSRDDAHGISGLSRYH